MISAFEDWLPFDDSVGAIHVSAEVSPTFHFPLPITSMMLRPAVALALLTVLQLVSATGAPTWVYATSALGDSCADVCSALSGTCQDHALDALLTVQDVKAIALPLGHSPCTARAIYANIDLQGDCAAPVFGKSLCCCDASCALPELPTGTIKVTVRDGANGNSSVEGAVITIGDNTYSTDANGEYTITGPAGDVTFMVSFGNYIPQLITKTITAGAELTFSVSLKRPLQEGSVNFYVVDVLGEVLEGAFVAINGTQLVTNFLGATNYTAYEGTTNYTVSRDGYLSQNGTVTIVANQATNASVVLQPEERRRSNQGLKTLVVE
eukprot:m.362882 g.362882  ORF g.362882 m.362882 type:complete len:323 (-) comp56021_c0_seq5:75-1043(-)